MTIPSNSNTPANPPANWSVSTAVTPEKTVTPQAVKAAAEAEKSRLSEQNADVFRPMQTQILREALLAGPPIRADKVAYARQLLSSPEYPPTDQLRHLATMLIADSMRSGKIQA